MRCQLLGLCWLRAPKTEAVPTETQLALWALTLREQAFRVRHQRFVAQPPAAYRAWRAACAAARAAGVPVPPAPDADAPPTPNWDAAWGLLQRLVTQGQALADQGLPDSAW